MKRGERPQAIVAAMDRSRRAAPTCVLVMAALIAPSPRYGDDIAARFGP